MKIFIIRTNDPSGSDVLASYDNEQAANQHLKALEKSNKNYIKQVKRLEKIYGYFNWTEHCIHDIEFMDASDYHRNLGGHSWNEKYVIEVMEVHSSFQKPVPIPNAN
jgi:hypothetical protein